MSTGLIPRRICLALEQPLSRKIRYLLCSDEVVISDLLQSVNGNEILVEPHPSGKFAGLVPNLYSLIVDIAPLEAVFYGDDLKSFIASINEL